MWFLVSVRVWLSRILFIPFTVNLIQCGILGANDFTYQIDFNTLTELEETLCSEAQIYDEELGELLQMKMNESELSPHGHPDEAMLLYKKLIDIVNDISM